jgi:hypothetical protein
MGEIRELEVTSYDGTKQCHVIVVRNGKFKESTPCRSELDVLLVWLVISDTGLARE